MSMLKKVVPETLEEFQKAPFFFFVNEIIANFGVI